MKKYSFDNMPSLKVLTNQQVEQVHEEVLTILEVNGVAFKDSRALDILENAGCIIDREKKTARMPRALVERAIELAPASFDLYDRNGNFHSKFGDGVSRFNMGSCAPNVLEKDNRTSRSSTLKDFNKIIKIGESLDVIDYVCTSVVIEEAPLILGEQYNYYAEIMNSTKPIIGGAIDADGTPRTVELLKAIRGSEKELKEKPYTIFDICVTSPMSWSEIAIENIIDCAKFGIPIEFISALISGITGPVTIIGSIVQHTVEMLSGIVFAQIISPGMPVVFGGAPCMFNMRTAYAPMSSIESDMITAGYGIMGKYYGIPTHTYAGSSDSKVVDYQAGSESCRTAYTAILSGIDNISGPGSLNCMAEMSPEKLVIDAEMICKLKHFEKGINFGLEDLGRGIIGKVGPAGSYMLEKETMTLFKSEHNYDDQLMSYEERSRWNDLAVNDVYEKAINKVDEIVNRKAKTLEEEIQKKLDEAFKNVCFDLNISDKEVEEMMKLCKENTY